jgi:hypothetical protein
LTRFDKKHFFFFCFKTLQLFQVERRAGEMSGDLGHCSAGKILEDFFFTVKEDK